MFKLTVVLVGFALFFPQVAFAKKSECRGVDSIARIGVPDGTPLTTESGVDDAETSGRFCAFSVWGVPASSPPLEAVQDALSTFNQFSLEDGIRNGLFAEPIAWALIAASSLTAPEGELVDFLSQSLPQIEECLAAMAENLSMNQQENFTSESGRFFGSCSYGVNEYYSEVHYLFLNIPELVVRVLDTETNIERLFSLGLQGQ